MPSTSAPDTTQPPRTDSLGREDIQWERELRQVMQDPEGAAFELARAKKLAGQACKAAEEQEKLMKELVEGNASLCHLEALQYAPDGRPRAICRVGSHLRSVGVHPDIDPEALEDLQPWEYVCVNEEVVVGIWRDDPLLWNSAQGDIVEFKGHADRENFQVRVTRPGHDETVATLAKSLRTRPLEPGTRLVLQQDDPRWAIGTLPADHAESRFEVPLDSIQTRLDQLAGLEEVTERFIEDVLLRVVYTDIRDQFDLTPLKGALLSSYKPGMGKTAFMRAFAVWLREFGKEAGFDTVLYHVKPNQLKSMWWGEDARIVREDLFGSIRARQLAPRERPLVQLLVCDEIDSLQKRSGGERTVTSSSHSDALEAMLVELEGIVQMAQGDGPPAHLLCVGMTNRPDRIDEALKRPGRFGDLVIEMPEIDHESAVEILAVYATRSSLPWQVEEALRHDIDPEEISNVFLRPAVAHVFPAVVARYATESQREIDVTAGTMLTGAHYESAMNRAKRRAALRKLHGLGVPAVTAEDVTSCLLEVAVDVARQMEADPAMLVNQLRISVPVVRVKAVPKQELEQHRFLKVHSA